MDLEGENQELLSVLLHSNITIPLELTQPVKGYHTIQNRNAQLRNLLMKHRALMDEQDSDDPEIVRHRRLKAARQKSKMEIDQKEQEAITKGDFSEINKIYGRKYQKMRDWDLLQKEQEKMAKKEETGRKYHARKRKNNKSLALMKKNKVKRSSSIEPKHKEKDSKSTPSKRPMSARNTVNLPVYESPKNDEKSQKRNTEKVKKKKHPKQVSFAIDIDSDEEDRKVKKRFSRKSPSESPNISPGQHCRNDSLQSTGSVVLHSGTTPKLDAMTLDDLSPSVLEIGYEASLDQLQDDNGIVAITPQAETEDDEDLLVGIERMASMHAKDAESIVFHNLRQSSSISLDTSWMDTDDGVDTENMDVGGDVESSSSELTFSDDGNEEEDENDEDMVPLGVQMMIKEEEENEKNHDVLEKASLQRMETLNSQRSME